MTLTTGEASLVCDALNGVWLSREAGAVDGVDATSTGAHLALEVEDGVRLNGLAQKWKIGNTHARRLVRRLAALSGDEAARVVRAVSAWWANAGATQADIPAAFAVEGIEVAA